MGSWKDRNSEIYMGVCVDLPVNVRSGKEKEKKKSWNDMNECLKEIGRRSRILLIGDMNGKVGKKIDRCVWKEWRCWSEWKC